MALRAAKRLHLDPPATSILKFLVENHLLLATVSQRRDLDDPTVIRVFSRQVTTPENLNLLTLLTFADSQGTSDKLWNGFKDSLLWQLHSRSMTLLTGGSEFIRAGKEQRELLRKEVRELAKKEISDDEIDAHFEKLPPRYLETRTAREITEDLELAHGFMEQLISDTDRTFGLMTAWQDEPDRGYNLVKICTWDRTGLFLKIAGSLSACGLNILGAQIFTRTDGIALDTFFVNDSRTGHLGAREQHEHFVSIFEKVLNGAEVDLPALIARQITMRPAYQAYIGERMATEIQFDNNASETRTVVEVETEDRLGLLYAIAQTFTELDVDIDGARILTERGAAIDSFYVRERNAGQIVSAERQELIKSKLLEAINRLESIP